MRQWDGKERYQIRKGAIVRMDFSSVVWEDEAVVFELKQTDLPAPEGWVWLKAPNYGGEPYGNGSVLARWEDVLEVFLVPCPECHREAVAVSHEFTNCLGREMTILYWACPQCGHTTVYDWYVE